MTAPASATAAWSALQRCVPALGIVSLALILFGAKLLVIGAYGNATPYWDQWDGEAAGLYAPFLEGRLGWGDMLAAHCEHRGFTARLLALGLLSANGLWNPLLQLVVNAAIHVGLVCLLAWLLTQAIGQRFLPVILAFCLALFSCPYGWENTLANNSSFYLLLLFAIGSLWLGTGAAPFSARWWMATGLAVCGFFSLASGAFVPAALAGIGVLQYLVGIRRGRLHLAAVFVLGGLFAAGVALTPSVAAHASLRAATLTQFVGSWSSMLGWPIENRILGPAVRNAPALLFTVAMLRARPPAEDRRWFLLTLVIWMLGQGLVICYGRAAHALASRYMDLFAIDILTNFACLLCVVNARADTRPWAVPAAAVWVAMVLGCLGGSVHKHCLNDLQARRDTAQAQELNTRNYVRTGDIGHLTDKPYLHVPYPVPERLAALLDTPSIRSVLPRNIRAVDTDGSPAAVGRWDRRVDKTLARWDLFVISGAVLAVAILTFVSLARPAAPPSPR
jgi:hypothetical protein